MKKCLVVLLSIVATMAFGQTIETEDWKTDYRAKAEKINDLVHTKLNASFDYSHSYLNGKVWITLKPHFYPTDSLQLDAKGMNIRSIAIVKTGKNVPLKYVYDSSLLYIKLDKTYAGDEAYTIYIDYTARPDELKTKGSAAITSAKGLYFINPKGEEKNKPTQVWTQGETESNSVWIPTIDKPNQKGTQEFNLTVPAKYVSLSNGKLAAQKTNGDGTRTDTWVMELPHSPYLFFIGIGDFAIVKDSYKGKEVNYYVEKEYEKVARKIFGYTPQMIAFYSDKVTGIDYPWNKYSQMVARDYVSGAMENTTATLHQSSAQQDARELMDGNEWEGTVAHELFHQWFGDLVTAESWSNLTVNESFANYSQTLWAEFKHGADAGAFENEKDKESYFKMPGGQTKNLVRFYYADKEDVFDQVTYEKGGRILHMLRNFVGDDAFFKSLNKYLITNRFGNGSAHKLRIAFEEVTGKDLNWFFDQWYFGSGHPALDISYGYDAAAKKAVVYLKQTQADKVFKLPFAIDVYHGASKKRYQVWAENRIDTFYFDAASKPDLINVDGDNILLCVKKDNKTLAEYVHQYTYAGKYLDRMEALEAASGNLADPVAYSLMFKALNDPFYILRSKALENFGSASIDAATVKKIETIAKNDVSRLVRADAIDVLARQKNKQYTEMFASAAKDSSYSVAGAALEALADLDGKRAFAFAEAFSREPNKGRLTTAIANVMIALGDESSFDFIYRTYEEMPLSQAKFGMTGPLTDMLEKVTDMAKFKKGVDQIVKLREEIPQNQKAQTDVFINTYFLKRLADKKQLMGAKEMADYVNSKLPK